jgi:hypothetical protein
MKQVVPFFSAVCLLCSGFAAEARKVENVYQGQILILKQRAPSRFRTNGAFARFLKTKRVGRNVWPVPKTSKSWRLEFMAFFRRPIDDVEVKVKFYDVTEGKRLIAADSIFTSARGQRILASRFTLERPDFQVDRDYMMVAIGGRGKGRRAVTRFTLRGPHERHNGHVVFSDEEAK